MTGRAGPLLVASRALTTPGVAPVIKKTRRAIDGWLNGKTHTQSLYITMISWYLNEILMGFSWD